MSDRAHIFSGSIVKFYNGEAGKVTYNKNVLCSPVVIGWEETGHKVVPVNETINDTSTGTDIKTDKTPWVIAVDESDVSRTVDIRDLTTQELEDIQTSIAANEADKILGEIQRRALNLIYSLAKVNDPGLSMTQFVTAFENTLGDEPITQQLFINYIRDNRLP